MQAYYVTPDGRYFIVRGRLWRCTNPSIAEITRQDLVNRLMEARRRKGLAIRTGDAILKEAARQSVDQLKHELGERGPVWWTDGTPDWNRHKVENTPYADWFLGLPK